MNSGDSPQKITRTAARPRHTGTSSPKLSLDLLLSVLSRTIFQPFIACLLPLCLRALASPYTSTSFIVTTLFAATVCIYHILSILNQRLAYGPPRKVIWKNELVVITGGCGGLGGCIAEIYGLRGVSVAVLDIAVSKEDDGQEKEGVHYYHCDLSQTSQIEKTWQRVKDDLGTPTILINNAATVSYSRVADSNATKVEDTFRLNTISHFITSRLLVSGLGNRRGGTVVTVSSVLGQLCATSLAAYSASKAALIAYHNTLSVELAQTAPQLKTILVAPGQLDTQLFAQAKVRGRLQNFVGPVLAAGELAIKIVGTIDAGNGGDIRMPFYANWAGVIAILPMSIQKGLRWWSGIDEALGQPQESAIDRSKDVNALTEDDDDSGASDSESDEED